MLWRNFPEVKTHPPNVPVSINCFDMNEMRVRVGKTRQAIRWNNTVIIKFNDGISCARQSTTHLHFKQSGGGVCFSCSNKQEHLVKSLWVADFELNRDAS